MEGDEIYSPEYMSKTIINYIYSSRNTYEDICSRIKMIYTTMENTVFKKYTNDTELVSISNEEEIESMSLLDIMTDVFNKSILYDKHSNVYYQPIHFMPSGSSSLTKDKIVYIRNNRIYNNYNHDIIDIISRELYSIILRNELPYFHLITRKVHTMPPYYVWVSSMFVSLVMISITTNDVFRNTIYNDIVKENNDIIQETIHNDCDNSDDDDSVDDQLLVLTSSKHHDQHSEEAEDYISYINERMNDEFDDICVSFSNKLSSIINYSYTEMCNMYNFSRYYYFKMRNVYIKSNYIKYYEGKADDSAEDELDPVSFDPIIMGDLIVTLPCKHIMTKKSFMMCLSYKMTHCPLCRCKFILNIQRTCNKRIRIHSLEYGGYDD